MSAGSIAPNSYDPSTGVRTPPPPPTPEREPQPPLSETGSYSEASLARPTDRPDPPQGPEAPERDPAGTTTRRNHSRASEDGKGQRIDMDA